MVLIGMAISQLHSLTQHQGERARAVASAASAAAMAYFKQVVAGLFPPGAFTILNTSKRQVSCRRGPAPSGSLN